MRRRRTTGNSLVGAVFRLLTPSSARMRRRRRKASADNIFWLAAVIGGIYVAVEIIRSPFVLVLAAGFLAAAVAYGRYAARSQAKSERQWRNLSRLRSFSGEEFENHVAETYRKKGYKVELTKTNADQGADVIVSKGAQRIAVQCKQWTAMVGNDAVQQALSGKIFYNCNQAVVICTSDFTPAAKELARRGEVTTINGRDYVTMVTTTAERESEARVKANWFPNGKPLVTQGALFALGSVLMVTHFAMTHTPSSPAPLTPAGPSVSQTAAVQASPMPSPGTPTPALDELQTMVVGNTAGEGVYLRRTPHMDDKLRAWPDGTAMEILGSTLQSESLKWRKVRGSRRRRGVPSRAVPGRAEGTSGADCETEQPDSTGSNRNTASQRTIAANAERPCGHPNGGCGPVLRSSAATAVQ